MNAVTVKNLTKVFRQGDEDIYAVDHVSFTVAPGEMVAIVGQSGSGKTTLLNLIGGIERPTSGSVEVGGVDICSSDDETLSGIRRRKLGYIFQDFNLIPILTAEENIIMPLLLDGKKPDLPKLADSYISDSFFNPDLPVWVQRYSVTGIDKEYGAATAAFVINADSTKTRVLCEEQTGGARLKEGVQASCWVQNGDTITVYIFGELPKEGLVWTLYENGGCEKVIEGTVSPEISEMTFKDYAFRGYDENSGILGSDWYNAQVELLRRSSETWGNGLIQIEEGDFSLMRWYEYTLTLEPGQALKNAVTAPLYPAIDSGYTPSLYAYTYLLSPAKTWAQFGELEVVVKTPYYMTESGIDGFTKTDGGYALTLPGLPEGELTFTLSESEKPQPPKWSSLYIMPTEFIIVMAAVLAAVGVAVFLLSRRKKRTKR